MYTAQLICTNLLWLYLYNVHIKNVHLIYLTNLFYSYNKKELTNVEIQEQTAFFDDLGNDEHVNSR